MLTSIKLDITTKITTKIIILIMTSLLVSASIIHQHKYKVCLDYHARLHVRESRFEKRDMFCYFYCGQFDWCRVVTIKTVLDGFQCLYHENLFDVDCDSFPMDAQGGYKLIYKKEDYIPPVDNGCQNGGTWLNSGCSCVENYVTSDCSRLGQNCLELRDVSAPLAFTLHMIKPVGSSKSMEVVCNIKFGSTLILVRDKRRFDGAFNRSWSEYTRTFGDSSNKSYWMGLEKLHILTNQPGVHFKLQVFAFKFSPATYITVHYNNFKISNASSSYAMTTGTLNSDKSGVNGMGENKNNIPFCTYDRPCNGYPNNVNGGWWYVTGLEKYAFTKPLENLLYLLENADFLPISVSLALERM